MTASITLTPDALIIGFLLAAAVALAASVVAAIALQRQKTSPATAPETPASQIKTAET